MPCLYNILCSGTFGDKKLGLFLLSNIAASSDKNVIKELLDEELLIDRILELSNNLNIEMKGEATWVIT